MELTPAVVVSIGVFLVGHLGAAIWFASRVNTQIKTLSDVVISLAADIKVVGSQDVRIAVLDQRLVAAEQRIRDTRDLVVGREARELERASKGD